jgi:hypothetical protein
MINQLVSQKEHITLTRNYLFPSQLAAHYITSLFNNFLFKLVRLISQKQSETWERPLSIHRRKQHISERHTFLYPSRIFGVLALRYVQQSSANLPSDFLLSSHVFRGFCNFFNSHCKISSDFLLSAYLFSRDPQLLQQQTENHTVAFRSLLVSW